MFPLHSAVVLALVLSCCPFVAADAAKDPFAGNTVITKRDQIPLVAVGKDGKSVKLGDTGAMAMIWTSKSDGNTVLVRYKGQDIWLAKADLLLPEDAAAHFTEVLRTDPKNVAALVRRGLALLRTNKPDGALEDLNTAVALDPKSAAARSYRGTVLGTRREHEKALADFEAATKLDPNWWVPINNRATMLDTLGKYDDAIKDYDATIKLESGLAIPFNNRGITWKNKGSLLKALADFGEALRLDPSFDLARLNRAQTYQTLKEWELATKDADDLIERNPATGAYRSTRGDIYRLSGAHAKAALDYEQAIKLNAKDVRSLTNLALLLATSPDDKVRDGKRAIELSSTALKLGLPAGSRATEVLAAAHAEVGDFDKAVEEQKKVVAFVEKNKTGGPNGLAIARANLKLYEEKKALRVP